MCRGAWDSLLKWDPEDQSACENSEAVFPDGAYRIYCDIVSASGIPFSCSLPVSDVSLSQPIPTEVIVDNFIPYVENVFVYTTYPYGAYVLLYSGGWISDGQSRNPLSFDGAYLPREVGKSPFGNLGVAIQFSEPMDPLNLPEVSLEGIWGDQTRWSSTSEHGLGFSPLPDCSSIPYVDPSSYSEWVCYETPIYIDPGYVGMLSLVINGGADLAGNALDENPADIDPVNNPLGSANTANTLTQDTNHTWGEKPPSYSRRSPSQALGTVRPYGYNFPVAIPYPLQDYLDWGPCPWWFGFWMCGATLESNHIDVDIVCPDGSYVGSSIGTYSIKSGLSMETPGTGEMYTVYTDFKQYPGYPLFPTVIATNDLLWVAYEDHYSYPGAINEPIGVVTTRIACISRETDCVLNIIVCAGEVWETEVGKLENTHLLNMSYDTESSIKYFYEDIVAPGIVPGEIVYGTLSVNSLDGNSMILNLEEDRQELQSDGQEIFPLSISPIQNPIVGSAALNFSTPVSGMATVQVFDLAGRSVQTLVNEEVTAGSHTVNWTPDHFASGVYFVRLTTPAGTVSTQAMVLR